ncbi:DNA/RNA helicase domain-containing protein [Evansella clarkii]|uniref:DNA/RNA helicase domain-containing protein n=1 Tax=Evansella clarkii TaxID=79879 RepID=UPI0014746FE1|nr:DNA/RNA helicase domain-containing protein [Evansella clarkii]
MSVSWKGTIEQFLSADAKEWLNELKRNTRFTVSEEQKDSWVDCYDVLQREVNKTNNRYLKHCGLIFEYELPREGGRRPDVILLTGDAVIVIEFKRKHNYSQADLDQLFEYSRNLQHYHKISQSKQVISVLLPTKMTRSSHKANRMLVLNPNDLHKYFDILQINTPQINIKEWINSEYAPLPSIIQAAQTIFIEKDLPQIKRAHSAGIPQTLQELHRIAEDSKQKNERNLVLITGVPGAGKTLVGLQFSHEYGREESENQKAIFLSGNGPLVKVLQYALQSDVYVKPLKNYVAHHAIHQREIPKENIIIFDEAQRAWDKERINNRYNIFKSEPELIISTADSINNWSVVIGLVGEGQEIHLGEEGGLGQWFDALIKSDNNWKVHCPEHVVDQFRGVEHEVNPLLNLSASLRTHIAEDVQSWIGAVLDGNSNFACQLSEKIQKQGYPMYITTELNDAKRYLVDRYEGKEYKRYGLLASSKSRMLPSFGVYNDFNSTKRMHEGKWFNEPPNSRDSCCSFNQVATEFSCQGLELDLPIVCWDADLIRENEVWEAKVSTKGAKNTKQLRLNSYRVLLSRGRDGLIIFVPPVPPLEETFQFLKKCGLTPLEQANTI